jgi:hypothetical protein
VLGQRRTVTVAKKSTIQGKRLQADTIVTMDLASGSEAIGFTIDVVASQQPS